MKITKSDFGTTNTGENINIYHLENEAGAYVEILNFGCRLVKIVVPDRNGNPTDVCLGMDTMSAYENDDASLGAVVGRVANRIKDGHFTLNGKEYHLAVNCGTNHLHGGLIGYASKPWDAKIKDDKLILTMISADGEEGYPGNLTLTVTYGWSEDNELSIVYEASADQDTLLNVTNHGYFNLNGEGSGDILSHELYIDADAVTELDDSQAPTGKLIPVDNTPFDFRVMHTIGKSYYSDYDQLHKFGTYDHNFVINGTGLREAAVLQSKESGIRMTCFTDQPGMQLYVASQPMKQPAKTVKSMTPHQRLLRNTAFPGCDQPRQLPKYRVTPGCTVPFQDAVSFFYILIKIIGRKSRMYRLCISGSILLSHSFVLIFVHGFFVF